MARSTTPMTTSRGTRAKPTASTTRRDALLPRLMAISSGLTSTVPTGDPAEPCQLGRWFDGLASVAGAPRQHQGPRSGPALMVQLREKHLEDQDLYHLARRARASFSGLLLVNGRLDIALAAGLDGVQLASTGLPPRPLTSEADRSLWIGVSTHSCEEVEQAFADGADFVLFGPVFDTPSKRKFGPAQGTSALASACELGGPVFAVGGIDSTTLAQALDAGAYGGAAIRACQTPADIERLLEVLVRRLG